MYNKLFNIFSNGLKPPLYYDMKFNNISTMKELYDKILYIYKFACILIIKPFKKNIVIHLYF